MTAEGEQLVARPSSPPWALLGAAAMLVLLGGNEGYQSSGEQVSFFVGYAAFLALIGWAVVWFGFRRTTRVVPAWAAFLALFAAAFGSSLAVRAYTLVQLDAATAGIRQSLDQAYAGDGPVSAGARASGDIGELEAFFRSSVQTAAADRDAYYAEFSKLQIDSMFSEAALSAPGHLNASKERLRSARGLIAKYRMLGEQREVELRTKAQALDVAPNIMNDVMAGLAKREPMLAEQRKAWQLESASMDALEAAVDVLLNSRWSVEGGRIIFAEDSDRRSFNTQMERVQAYGAEQDAIQKAQLDRAKAAFAGSQ